MTSTPPNQCVKWIREPVALFACAKNPPEPLTTYAGRYIAKQTLEFTLTLTAV